MAIVSFIVLISAFAWVYRELPTSFLPQEDQGLLGVQFRLAEGTPMSQTQLVGQQISDYFLSEEKDNLNGIMVIHGRNFFRYRAKSWTSFCIFKTLG